MLALGVFFPYNIFTARHYTERYTDAIHTKRDRGRFVMIRFLIVCAEVIGFLIVFLPVMLVEIAIGKFNPRARDISSLRIVQGAFRLILWTTGVRITEIGHENVPTDQAVLYIGNHRSFFDILLTYTRCPDLTGYVAKKSMEKVPLLSIWMKLLHCLFMDRENLKEGLKTILAGVDLIKSGISVCIFPEGTRSHHASDLDMLPFHEGSFKLATKTDCPIIPISINNSSDIWEAHFPKIKRTHVIVEYGKPIIPSELSKEDKKHIGTYVQNVILETLKKNEKLL